MSMTLPRYRSIYATAVTVLRFFGVPMLGGATGIASAVLLLALIRHVEAVAGRVEHVPALVPMVVLISYAAVGAFAATILLPRKG